MQNEIKLDVAQKIIIILHALGALEEYKKEYGKAKGDKQSIYSYIKSVGPNAISRPFVWDKTEKGNEYWRKIDYKIRRYLEQGFFAENETDIINIKNRNIRILGCKNHCYLVDDFGVMILKNYGIEENKFQFCGIPESAGGIFPWHDSLAKINETIIKIIVACDMPIEAIEPTEQLKTESESVLKTDKKQLINIKFQKPKTLICKL